MDGQTDGQTDRQNYDFQDRASIAASRGKNCSMCCSCDILCISYTLDYYQTVINDVIVIQSFSVRIQTM